MRKRDFEPQEILDTSGTCSSEDQTVQQEQSAYLTYMLRRQTDKHLLWRIYTLQMQQKNSRTICTTR